MSWVRFTVRRCGRFRSAGHAGTDGSPTSPRPAGNGCGGSSAGASSSQAGRSCLSALDRSTRSGCRSRSRSHSSTATGERSTWWSRLLAECSCLVSAHGPCWSSTTRQTFALEICFGSTAASRRQLSNARSTRSSSTEATTNAGTASRSTARDHAGSATGSRRVGSGSTIPRNSSNARMFSIFAFPINRPVGRFPEGHSHERLTRIDVRAVCGARARPAGGYTFAAAPKAGGGAGASALEPPSSSGLGFRPFKAATRVRIPLGAPNKIHAPVEESGRPHRPVKAEIAGSKPVGRATRRCRLVRRSA